MDSIKECKEKLKTEAEVVVYEEIPKIITQLNELINSDKFSPNEEFETLEISENMNSENKTIEKLIEIIRPIIVQFDHNVKLLSFILLLMAEEFKQGKDPWPTVVNVNPSDFNNADRFADTVLQEFGKYFQDRSDKIPKIIEKPEDKDLIRSLKEFETAFIHKLQLSLIQTRNYYIQLHTKFIMIGTIINLALNPANNSVLTSKYLK